MKKRVAVLTMIALMFTLCCNVFSSDSIYYCNGKMMDQSAFDKTISGKISLPDGMVATEDISVSIHVFPEYKENPDCKLFVSEEVVIKKDTQYAQYQIFVPSGFEYYVRFVAFEKLPVNLIPHGFYNENGAVFDYIEATKIDVTSNAENINIEFMMGIIIEGSMFLPEGIITSQNTNMTIYVNSPKESNNGYYSNTSIDIPEGVNSFSYSVCVKENQDYILGFYGDDLPGVLNRGFYSQNGAVINYSEASLISVKKEDIKDLNFELQKGVSIEGIISMPDGMNAPEGGLNIYLDASTDNGTFDIWEDDYFTYGCFTIPEGENSVNYSLTVIPSNAGYNLTYYIYQNDLGLYSYGYYSSNGITIDYSKMTPIQVENEPVKADIVLGKGKLIKGTVRLPEGITAPQGLNIYLNAYSNNESKDTYDNNYNGDTSCYIPEGENSGEFSMVVAPSKSGYTLNYNLYETIPGVIRHGYYNEVECTHDYNNASRIVVEEDVEGIIINLAKGFEIAGTVLMPEGEFANEPLYININASSYEENNQYYGWTDFVIEQGECSKEFSITVPASGNGYILQYSLDRNSMSLLSNGYYNPEGLTTDFTKATAVVPGDGVKDINMVLLKGVQIRGKISLPEGQVAPPEGIWVHCAAEENEAHYYDTVCINQGLNSEEFFITVDPSRTDYILSYFVWENSLGVLSRGYYSAKGTVSHMDYAGKISDFSEFIDFKLLKGSRIKGKIVLPDGAKAPEGGLDISLTATSVEGYDSYYEYLHVKEGENSASYSITVAPNLEYTLNYYLFGGEKHNYYSEGYYSNSGTEYTKNKSTSIIVDKDVVEDKNLTLLKTVSIKGEINIPKEYLNKEYAYVVLCAINDNDTPDNYEDDTYTKSIIDIKGESKVPFELKVAPNVNSGYKIYYITECQEGNYVNKAFYGKNGMVGSYKDASSIKVNNKDVKGIKLSFLKGVKVSGVINIEEPQNGEIAPKEMNIVAYSNNNTELDHDDLISYKTIKIPDGQYKVSYDINVVPQNQYELSIYQYSTYDYVNGGTYNKSGTDYTFANPDKVTVKRSNIKDINFNISRCK